MTGHRTSGIHWKPTIERGGPAMPITLDRAYHLVNAAIDGTGMFPPGRLPSSPGLPWHPIMIGVGLLGVVGVSLMGILLGGPLFNGSDRTSPTKAMGAVPREPPPTMPAVIDQPGVLGEPAGDQAGERQQERSPQDLLRLANDLRRAQRWRSAEHTYQRVLRGHPRSDEAYVATVAAAGLQLEHLRNPRGALRLYRSALSRRRGGHLAEEARYGTARAHRAMGNREREHAALEQLLAQHPTSVWRARAEARLRELVQR